MAIASWLLVASGLLNCVLVLALLAREQHSLANTVATTKLTSSWCQPRPTSLLERRFGEDDDVSRGGGVGGARGARGGLLAYSSPPPSTALPSASDHAHDRAAVDERFATDEGRLKRLWYMEPHGPRASARARQVEIHDPKWTFLDDRQLARGLATVGDPQRLRCLAEKLLAGKAVHLSVVGGSISFGTTFTTSRSRALFHWKVYQYLNASFSGAAHEHYMGAVPASGPSYMEHCVAWHLPPPGADLILVEYAVNFDAVEDDAASFERLVRKLLRLPNAPAVVIVNTMELVPPGGRLPWEPPDESIPYPSARDLEFDYKGSGAEDAIHAIADYYGVPCVSLRGAVFSELKANATAFPIKQLYHDRHHPSAWGHSLMAQMAVTRLREAIHDVLAAQQPPQAQAQPQPPRAPSACDVALREARSFGELRGPPPRGRAASVPQPGAPRLSPPIFARGDEAEVGTCDKERALAARIHTARGFAYAVEGTDLKMKPGVIGHRAGDSVQFCVDTSRLSAGSGFVFILGHLISYEHMGAAIVSCVDECACPTVAIDAHVPGGRFSVFKAKTVHATRVAPPAGRASAPRDVAADGAPCGCKVQVTILEETGSGERKFKVLSLMTALKEGSLRYGHQAGFNNRPTEARFH